MKILPTGVQSIEQIVQENRIYVDKTKLIYELIQLRGYYFLTRPRRFGKTLLVDTLKAIFQGRKELFRECYIGTTDYSWEKYPVITMDFGVMNTTSPENLEKELQDILHSIGRSYGIVSSSATDSSLEAKLRHLIENLSRENKVVVLIDEYDKPIITNLDRINIAEANRDVLKRFFGTLKGLYTDLRFVFITGVSKFSQVSLFSGLNNVIDLTMDPTYGTLLGYTEAEIQLYFREHIKLIAEKRSQTGERVTEEQVLREMREWYNGYRFSTAADSVYNPHSTLNFLRHKEVEEYWFESGTTSYLIKQVQEAPLLITELTGASAKRADLLNIQNLQDISLPILLWQTGYLTIQGYDELTRTYSLGFPNREVREAFFYSLIVQLGIRSPVISAQSVKCREQLERKDLRAFFETVNTFYAKVPYHLWNTACEGFYHALLIMLLEAIGVRVLAEVATNIGRIDLVLEASKITYVMECKLDKDSDKALAQIEGKKYKDKYVKSEKEIVLVVVNFSSHTRNVSNWKAISVLPSGEEIFISSGYLNLKGRD